MVASHGRESNLAARIAAHEKRRAALAAQSEAEPSASEGADKGDFAKPEYLALAM